MTSNLFKLIDLSIPHNWDSKNAIKLIFSKQTQFPTTFNFFFVFDFVLFMLYQYNLTKHK